jgi:hypothetical protein
MRRVVASPFPFGETYTGAGSSAAHGHQGDTTARFESDKVKRLILQGEEDIVSSTA